MVGGKRSLCPAILMLCGVPLEGSGASGTLTVIENLLPNAAGHWEKFLRNSFFKKNEIFLSFSVYKTCAFGLMQLVFGRFYFGFFFFSPCGVNAATPVLEIATQFQ